jgi:hypothetical protein
MAGIWRKLGGVFLEYDEAPETGKPRPVRAAQTETPAAMAGDADDLLAQLEGRKPAGRPRRARSAPSAPAAPRAETPPPSVDPLSMDAPAIYAAAGIGDNPNSADRILKMIGGLAAFPPPQQRAMIQALDAADPSWSEPEVLTDARARQTSLRSHLRAIEQEKSARGAALRAEMKQVEELGLKNLNEIDKQIAELQELREQQAASTSSQFQKMETEATSLETASEAARLSITGEINRLSGLMTFFTGGGAS